jgi:hypothetical protein
MRRLRGQRERDRERRLPGFEDEDGSDEAMNPSVLFRIKLEAVLAERERERVAINKPRKLDE